MSVSMSTPIDGGWALAAGTRSPLSSNISRPLPSHLCRGNGRGVSQDCAYSVMDRCPGMGSEAVRRTRDTRNIIPLTLEQYRFELRGSTYTWIFFFPIHMHLY